jgi:hypothetical protein
MPPMILHCDIDAFDASGAVSRSGVTSFVTVREGVTEMAGKGATNRPQAGGQVCPLAEEDEKETDRIEGWEETATRKALIESLFHDMD